MSKHPTTRGLRRAANARRQAAQVRKYRREFAWLRRLQPYHCIGGVAPDVEAIVQARGRKDRDNRQPRSGLGYGHRRELSGPPIGELREPPLLAEDLRVAYLSLGAEGLRVEWPGEGTEEAP